ncbi:unnamed protein product [Calicophoron daubneyi]|uniref:Ileal sodium/bile acid cotransporter n=1 Tax=Calicophoron daubneyi TaxID=300641 RepID=A0AAV2TD59_CALDB
MRLLLVLVIIPSFCHAVPDGELERPIEVGLELKEETRKERLRFEDALANQPHNSSYFEYSFISPQNRTTIVLQILKSQLRYYDDYQTKAVLCNISYTSPVPLTISYDLDSTLAVVITNSSWHWLPPSMNVTHLSVWIYITSRQIGISYLRFWIREAKQLTPVYPITSLLANNTQQYYASLANQTSEIHETVVLGFPVIVIRYNGVAQIVFRVFVIILVTVFTFTMGCELDQDILKQYIKKPIGPAIGFCCQFIIMPVAAFVIAMVIPIRKEFGFGLLTVGCSPGGGASNGWSLLLGGDINLSILMTFISSFCALFMMPALLFIFGRFFIDVNNVQIPYGNIVLQLLQITTPALLGLLLRWRKPEIAKKFTKITRPLFVVFIIFFMSLGVYANLSLFRMLGDYPIVLPAGALLPWTAFALGALVAFICRQPRPLIITIALETGIQNMGAAILVLMYSMPQPAGDLGAIMPLAVGIFTPLPLYITGVVILIKRKCCKKKQPIRVEEGEVEGLKDGQPKYVNGLKAYSDGDRDNTFANGVSN